MDVYSENSYGVCVPANSSANEVIIGMARAAALASSGAKAHHTSFMSLRICRPTTADASPIDAACSARS